MALLLFVLTSALAFTACSSDSASVSAFDVNNIEDRPLPEDVTASGQFDPTSARFVVSFEGVDYYVARPDNRDNQWACLIGVPIEGEWSGGCSTIGPGQVVVKIGSTRTQAALVTDDADVEQLAQDGWTELHRNLWVLRS